VFVLVDSSMGKLSVVLPAYNEASNILSTLSDVDSELSNLGVTYEVIVVDDGSTDGTAELALKSNLQELRVVSHPENRGYGAALKSGFRAANGDYLFFMDSDGQFRMEEFPKVLEALEDGQAVFGYRRKRQDPALRRVNGWAWTALVNLLFDLRVRDIDCAFKLLPSGPVKNLNLETSGAMVNTELAAKLKARGVRWKQVPVEHFPRLTGKQTGNNLRVVLHAFRELWSFWRKWRAGSYRP